MSPFGSGTLAVLACAACLCGSIARADQKTLKDGDRVSGTIVKNDGQIVTIHGKNFCLVTLKWDEIATVNTHQSLNVVLPGRTLKASLPTVEDRIQLAASEGRQMVAASEVVASRNDAEEHAHQRLLHPGVFDLWAISGSLNFAGARGHAETSMPTAPFNFVRASRTSRTTACFNSIRSSAALGGGLGYLAWKGETGRLALVGGAAWNREKFSPGTRQGFMRSSAEAYWGYYLNYELSSRSSLMQGFRMINNLSSTGDYRSDFEIGAWPQTERHAVHDRAWIHLRAVTLVFHMKDRR